MDATASQAGHLLSTPSTGIISVPRLSSARTRDCSLTQELVQASLRHLPSGGAAIHPVAEHAAAEAAADDLRGGKRGKRAKPVRMGRAERESLADALLRCLPDYDSLDHPCRPGLSCIFAHFVCRRLIRIRPPGSYCVGSGCANTWLNGNSASMFVSSMFCCLCRPTSRILGLPSTSRTRQLVVLS